MLSVNLKEAGGESLNKQALITTPSGIESQQKQRRNQTMAKSP